MHAFGLRSDWMKIQMTITVLSTSSTLKHNQRLHQQVHARALSSDRLIEKKNLIFFNMII